MRPRPLNWLTHWRQGDAGAPSLEKRRTLVQRMRIVELSSCSRFGQVVLEDPDGMVRLCIRLRPIMAHWLAHELKE